MKNLSLLACLLLSSTAFAARSPHPTDEVAKIAVGPKAKAPTPAPAPAPDEDEAAPSDAADAVDKPIRKPVVVTTDAPKGSVDDASPAAKDDADSELAAAAKPAAKSVVIPEAKSAKAVAPSKPTLKPSVKTPAKDEGSITLHGVDEKPPAVEADDGEADETAPIKAAPAKTKLEVLKPVPGPVPPTVREEKSAPKAPVADVTKPVEASKPVVDGVTAEQSQKWLENGNVRYTTHKFRADGRGDKERAAKTKPHAIVLSCSDSRVPPELIFDQGLGEIVTIRVAAEVLDDSVIASIEQTIMNEHPHLLVVLGHTQCSSIETAFNWKDTASFGSDALDRMVNEIKPHMKTLTSPTRSPGFQVEAALQADGVARDLTERSEIVKKAVAKGELVIKTGLYWVDTGKVKFY